MKNLAVQYALALALVAAALTALGSVIFNPSKSPFASISPRSQTAQASGASCTDGDLSCGLLGTWSYDGTAYTDAGHLAYLEGAGDVSFSLWADESDDANSLGLLFAQYAGATGGWIMYRTTAGGAGSIECQTGTHDLLSGSGILVPGTKVHIVCVSRGGSTSIYKNGVLVKGPAPEAVVGSDQSAHFTVGGPTTAGVPPFNGTISDLRVYSRALSADEVCQLYQLGGRFMRIERFKRFGKSRRNERIVRFERFRRPEHSAGFFSESGANPGRSDYHFRPKFFYRPNDTRNGRRFELRQRTIDGMG